MRKSWHKLFQRVVMKSKVAFRSSTRMTSLTQSMHCA
ncbi:hypothetical protein V6Z11_A09G016900 [Gossypium hirsutum]